MPQVGRFKSQEKQSKYEDINRTPSGYTDAHQNTRYNETDLQYLRGQITPVLTPRFNKLQKDRDAIGMIDMNVVRYEASTRRKKMAVHHDWELKHMHPPDNVIKERLNGRPCTDHGKNRQIAIEHGNALPSLKFPTSRLEDRVRKYQKNARKEQELEKIVKEANGIREENRQHEGTIANKEWRVLPGTRSLTARDNCEKGRRGFPCKCKEAIDQFS